jgi:acid phosphatase
MRLLLALLLGLALGLPGLAQRLAVLGDWGAETPHRPLVAQAIQQQHQARPFAALLTLGDNFYPRGEPVQRYLDELPPVRIYPAFGNHDIPALASQLRLFAQEQAYYHVPIDNLEIVVLYSEDFSLAQRRWLEDTLRNAQAPWRVVLLHRPLYSSGPHGGSRALRQALEPLLTQYRVALVLSGHEHSYERLLAKGVVHIVSGGGGAWLRGFVSVRPQSKVRLKSPNYLVLEATAQRLQVTAYNEKNVVIDQVELRKP